MAQSVNVKGVVVQFAKAPIVGQVKTRLSPVLTAEQSAALHCALVKHTQNLLKAISQLEVTLAVSDMEHAFWQDADFAGMRIWPQPEGDLGQRMQACFESLLTNEGKPWVILIGSDCPAIDAGYIASAIKALEQGQPLVLGPATDGGYVLIAMSEPLSVFQNVNWGSAQVLAQTCANAQKFQITPFMLEPLADIDRPEDLAQLHRYSDLCYWSTLLR